MLTEAWCNKAESALIRTGREIAPNVQQARLQRGETLLQRCLRYTVTAMKRLAAMQGEEAD